MKRKRLILFILIITILITAVLIMWVSSNSTSLWEFTTPMPYGRWFHDAVLGPDGKIYVVGGDYYTVSEDKFYDDKTFFSSTLHSLIVYDPKTKGWEDKSRVPSRGNEEFQLMKRNVFVKDAKGSPREVGEYYFYYKRESDEPSKRRDGIGVAATIGKNGLLYWIGANDYDATNDVLAYEIKTDRWLKTPLRPEIPVLKDNDLSFKYSSSGEIVAPVMDKAILDKSGLDYKKYGWSAGGHGISIEERGTIAPMNEARMYHRAVKDADEKIYVMGGWRAEDYYVPDPTATGKESKTKLSKALILNSMEVYDPAINTWTYKSSMRHARHQFAAVLGQDGKIYVFGGFTGQLIPFRLDINLSKEENAQREREWRESFKTIASVEVYDPETDRWEERKPMSRPRQQHAAALGADGRIYLMGGLYSPKGKTQDTVDIYDPVTDTWEAGPSMNIKRIALAAVSTPDGKIYAIGGSDMERNWRPWIGDPAFSRWELFTGRRQHTVEVLDIKKLKR